LQAGHIGRIVEVAGRKVRAVVHVVANAIRIDIHSRAATDTAGISVQTAAGSRVIVVASEQIGTVVQRVADAVEVIIRTSDGTLHEHIVKGDGLTVRVRPDRDPDLQCVACGNRILVENGRGEVVKDIEDLCFNPIHDDVTSDEVGILEVSGFLDVHREQDARRGGDVDFTGQPCAIEVAIPDREEVGRTVVVRVEVVCCRSIGDAPFRFRCSGIGRTVPAVAERIVLEVLRVKDARTGALTTEVGFRATGIDIIERQRIAIVTRVSEVDAAAVILRCGGIVVACNGTGTTLDLRVVADAVAIRISGTSAATDTEHVGLVAEAVAVAGRDAGATADTALIDLVAEAVAVAGRDAGAATDAALVELEARCIGRIGIVAGRQIGAVVHIVAEAIAVNVRSTGAAAHAKGVELVAGAVAVARQDAGATADTTFINGAARAIGRIVEVAGRDVGTVVLIVADAVGIDVRAVAAALAAGIDLVAEAVAITDWNAGATTNATFIGEEAGIVEE